MRSLAILVLSLSTALAAFAQNATVTGRVIDELDEPMIGAGVMQKGTTNGTITDLDGQFRLVVPKGATVVFTTIGYLTEERVIDGDVTLEIKLMPDSQMIEETVVVGYGVQRKSDVTGSISQVKEEDIQTDLPAGAVVDVVKIGGNWYSFAVVAGPSYLVKFN